MHYQIDLDPTHSVIRLKITEEMMSLECAEEVYRHLRLLTAHGGPYAAIYDLTKVKNTTIPVDLVRSCAQRPPSVPMGRPHVVVGEEPAIFGLARLFQMCREFRHGEFEVVHTLEEAYYIVGARPEDFTERIFPAERAA